MSADFESGFLCFGADMGVDLSFNQARGLSAELCEEGVEV